MTPPGTDMWSEQTCGKSRLGPFSREFFISGVSAAHPCSLSGISVVDGSVRDAASKAARAKMSQERTWSLFA